MCSNSNGALNEIDAFANIGFIVITMLLKLHLTHKINK